MGFKEKLKYNTNFRILGNFYLHLNLLKKQSIPSNWREDILTPPLKIGKMTKFLISRHYLEGRYAKGVKSVAWVTSGAPVEILKALDYYVLYPENHAAICGAKKIAHKISQEAEKYGFSIDICSYARTDIGSVISGKTPVGKLPKPDILFTCTNICQTVLYWYQALSHFFKVPLILVDTPFLYEEAGQHQIEYVKKQLENMVPTLEKVSGKKFKVKKLEKVLKLSKCATELWLKIVESGKNVPSPISVFDQFIHMAPIVEMRGEKRTVKFYMDMLKEVEERIKLGIGAVKNEKKRLMWDNLPIWHRLRYFSEFLAEYGVSVVFSTYTNAWGELYSMIDPQRPFESMAKTYLHPILNRGTGYKLKVMEEMAVEYKIDGIILHSDRSCKPYSMGQVDQRNILTKKGIPSLLLEADHNDPRTFSEKQIENRLRPFLEILGV